MKKGDKVWCWYHFTRFFKPPMCGKILCKYPYRKKHHFSRKKDGKCHWYVVKMVNSMIVSMPETCIDKLQGAIDKHNNHNECPYDLKQIDAWIELNKWQADRVKYLIAK